MQAKIHTVLVLGASGRMGRAAMAVFEKAYAGSIKAIPVYRGKPKAQGLSLFDGDQLDQFPKVDAVFALWGVVSGDEQALAENIALARHAVSIAQSCGAARVFHCSTVAVYGPSDVPISEAGLPDPQNAYGRSKRAMELEVQRLNQSTAVRSSILRIGNVAGTGPLFDNMAAKAPMTLDRFTDGAGPIRSYIGPCDFAHVLAGLLDVADLPEVINIAARTPTTMDALLKAYGTKFEMKDAPKGARQKAVMDTALLKSLLPDLPLSGTPDHLLADATASGIWP